MVYRTVASNGTCDSVRRVIAYLGFGFQAGHLFILFFVIAFDNSQPVWMLAETRLDNNCSLIIAKCWRNGLLVGGDFKTQWTITAQLVHFQISISGYLFGRIDVVYERIQCNRSDDDDEFRFNDASTHEGHLRQNGKLTWFCNETAIKVSYICIKCKTRTNLKIKAVRLC